MAFDFYMRFVLILLFILLFIYIRLFFSSLFFSFLPGEKNIGRQGTHHLFIWRNERFFNGGEGERGERGKRGKWGGGVGMEEVGRNDGRGGEFGRYGGGVSKGFSSFFFFSIFQKI